MLILQAIALCALALPAPETAAEQASQAYKVFQEQGQSEAGRIELLALLEELEKQYPDDYELFLAESSIYGWLGDYETAQVAFAKVPDDALKEAWHISNRLGSHLSGNLSAAPALMIRLADMDPDKLADTLHNSYAQAFAPALREGTDLDQARVFLSAFEKEETATVWYLCGDLAIWLDALSVKGKPKLLESLADRLTLHGGPYASRYKLLLAERMLKEHGMRAKAKGLLQVTLVNLLGQKDALKAIPKNRNNSYGRGRLRYRIAHAYSLLSGLRDGTEAHRKAAAHWSPDARDLANSPGYFYEMVTLGGRSEYRSSYADHLESTDRQEQALATWVELTLMNPERIDDLSKAFARIRPGNDFGVFWGEQLSATLPKIIDFELQTLDGKTFRSIDHRGEWVLLDFWGTWCGPCRKELPALQKLVESLADTKSPGGVVLTLACKDQEQTVREFLTQKKYTFPVAMGTESNITNFQVEGFPTKVLITPQGHWFQLQYSTRDWRSLVDRYLVPEE